MTIKARPSVHCKQTQLDNGLQIVGEINDQAKSLAVGFFTRTGARDESPEIAGTSHFLEHMMFKGTAKRSALEVNLTFDAMGAKYNAFTSEENTVYYAAVLPEYQCDVLELWADLMRPALREDDFNLEKGVICEEIAMYQDMPHFDVLDRCRALHFGGHGCANSVLGTVESIQALKRDQMLDYFQRRYAPDNMILAATGAIDFDALVADAQQLCGHWESAAPRRELTDMPGTGKCKHVTSESIVRQHICMMTPAPAAADAMRHGADVLSYIIGDSTASRLYWALVDSALADTADMDFDAMDGTGAFYTYVSCDPTRRDAVIDTVRQIVDEVKRDGVTDSELAAAKNKIASTMTLRSEIPMGRLVPLGFGWMYRQDYQTIEEELAAIEAVDAAMIGTLLEQWPQNTPTIMTLGPAKDQ